MQQASTTSEPVPSAVHERGSLRSVRAVVEIAALVNLFLLMLITFVDVVGRATGAAVPGGYELTQYAMALLVFCGLPLVTAVNGHIRVSLVDNLLPKSVVRIRELLFGLVAAVIMGGFAWRLSIMALQLAEYGEETQHWDIPLAPLCWVMAVSSAITGLVFLAVGILGFRGRVIQPPE